MWRTGLTHGSKKIASSEIGNLFTKNHNTECKINRKNGELNIALKTLNGYEIYDAETEHRQISQLSIPITKWEIISTAGFEKKNNEYIQITANDMFLTYRNIHSFAL